MCADIPIYLFAKAPREGRVKTRLHPPLPLTLATEVAVVLLERGAASLAKYWPGEVVLTVDPDASHPVFERLIKQYGFAVEVQIQAGLGERMLHVLHKGIQQAGAAAVVGTDIPGINQPILAEAYAAISRGQSTIGPTVDGGFYLLGARAMSSTLFADVNWGSEQVLAKVQSNAEQHKLEWHYLPKLHDVDTYADLKLAAKHSRVFRQFMVD